MEYGNITVKQEAVIILEHRCEAMVVPVRDGSEGCKLNVASSGSAIDCIAHDGERWWALSGADSPDALVEYATRIRFCPFCGEQLPEHHDATTR